MNQNGKQIHSISWTVNSIIIALFGLTCLLASTRQTAWGQTALPVAPTSASPNTTLADEALLLAATDSCADLTAVPLAECMALVTLYQNTDGPHWQIQTNWLTRTTPASPCDWYGITCNGGHVVQLALVNNRLQGELPRTIGAFTHLRRLFLADNLLRGFAPPSICDLADTIQEASFGYNRLSPLNLQVKQCLDRLDPDWWTTQTVAPQQVQPAVIMTATIVISWTPIAYTGDGGFYEVAYATTPDAPYVVHGITADKSAASYQLTGLSPGQTYHIRLRTFTPAHLNQHNDLWSDPAPLTAVTQSDGQKVLLLLYFPADNDLSPYLESTIRRLRLGTQLNPNVQVLMLGDARGAHNTAVFEIASGMITRTTIIQEQWGGRDELNTMDPGVLAWFLRYGRTHYPASRTVVSLMGHGAGMTPEVIGAPTSAAHTSGQAPAGIPALPQTIPATPGDEADNGDYLSTPDFAQALAAATDNGANPFDVIFFDQCFQGNLDVLYEMHNFGHTLVASPNYAWLVAPYHKYLTAFTPAATPEALAEAIMRIYQGSLTNQHPNVILWVRGADLPPIAAAVDKLGLALQNAAQQGAVPAITQASLNSQYVDTTQCGFGNEKLGPPDELLGAGSLARNLLRGFGAGDSFGVYTAAADLLTELEKVHSLARTGRPYTAPETFWDYTDKLTIIAPLLRRMNHREMMEAKIWRASIYKPNAPFTALWAPDPQQRVTVSATFAYAREGQWDDFITSWYTNPLTPTIGAHCHYMPPALIEREITETLALTITPDGQTLVMDWTPTNDPDATDYWLLARPAQSGRWHLLASVPLTQTNFLVQRPQAGLAYQLMIVARDESGVTLAESNEIRYAETPLETDKRTYLPVIQR